jgi:hypothetical protein
MDRTRADVAIRLLEEVIEANGQMAIRDSIWRGAATNLKRIGVDDFTISHILGHSDVSITRKCYIGIVDENNVAAMQKGVM